MEGGEEKGGTQTEFVQGPQSTAWCGRHGVTPLTALISLQKLLPRSMR